MIAPALLLLTVVAVLVDSWPQENFIFPEKSARSSRFPLQPPVQSSDGQSPTIFPSQMPSQPFSSTRPTTTSQENEPESTSASTTSDGKTTRIPPPDPAYRIVYTIPKTCDCLFTPQYNPVCGTDGRTYGNFGIMSCNKQCGVDVDVYLMGACGRNNG